MTPIPILYVHHRPELGGAPTSLAYLIRELDRTRFEPHVYSPPGAASAIFRDAGATVHEGVAAAFTHIWTSTYSGRRWLLLGRELSLLPPHLRRFRTTLAKGDFGLVHLNDSPLIPAAWMASRRGLPVVWHLRSALPSANDSRARLVRRAICRFSSVSIAINHDVARSFDVGAIVIPNSVDLMRFRPEDSAAAKDELLLPHSRAVVAFFGFLYPSKGFEDLVEAAAILHRRGIRATYLIVGGGVRNAEFFKSSAGRLLQRFGFVEDYEGRARGRVSLLKMSDDIRFVAYTDDPTTIYQAADVVVAPSRGPELGRPVLEAAASGRPVVATGSRDGAGVILPDETGLLAPPSDPRALAAALERLLGDPALREALGERAREYAVQTFDPRANAKRVVAVYDRLLQAHNPSN